MTFRIRSGLLGAVAVVAVVAVSIAPGAIARAPLACDVQGFSMGPQPADVPNRPEKDKIVAEWTVDGSTTMNCPGMGVLALDVWEHAYYVISPDGPVRGRVEVLLSTPSRTLGLRGRVRGTSDCDADMTVCALSVQLRAASGSGDRLELDMAQELDLAGTVGPTSVSGGDLVLR